jgi:2,4-didehydro-3-deoxy-L-rhamnonate hydrolase
VEGLGRQRQELYRASSATRANQAPQAQLQSS